MAKGSDRDYVPYGAPLYYGSLIELPSGDRINLSPQVIKDSIDGLYGSSALLESGRRREVDLE